MRRVERGGLIDLMEQPFAELARAVLAVQIEGGGKRRVIPVGLLGLLLAELRLRPDIGPHRARLLKMGIAFGNLSTFAGRRPPVLPARLGHYSANSSRHRQVTTRPHGQSLESC